MTTWCSGLRAVRGHFPQPGDIEACGGIRGVWGRLCWPGREVKAPPLCFWNVLPHMERAELTDCT